MLNLIKCHPCFYQGYDSPRLTNSKLALIPIIKKCKFKLFTTSRTPINADLTANSKKYTASYQNNKYGFLIDGNFYEIGGGGMPVLDRTNPLYTFDASHLSFTATKKCYLEIAGYGQSGGATGSATVTIDGELVSDYSYSSGNLHTSRLGIIAVASGQAIVVTLTNGGIIHAHVYNEVV